MGNYSQQNTICVQTAMVEPRSRLKELFSQTENENYEADDHLQEEAQHILRETSTHKSDIAEKDLSSCFDCFKEEKKGKKSKQKKERTPEPYDAVKALTSVIELLEGLKTRTFRKLNHIKKMKDKLDKIKKNCQESEKVKRQRECEEAIDEEKEKLLKRTTECVESISNVANAYNVNKYVYETIYQLSDKIRNTKEEKYDSERDPNAEQNLTEERKSEILKAIEAEVLETEKGEEDVEKHIKFSKKVRKILRKYFQQAHSEKERLYNLSKEISAVRNEERDMDESTERKVEQHTEPKKKVEEMNSEPQESTKIVKIILEPNCDFVEEDKNCGDFIAESDEKREQTSEYFPKAIHNGRVGKESGDIQISEEDRKKELLEKNFTFWSEDPEQRREEKKKLDLLEIKNQIREEIRNLIHEEINQKRLETKNEKQSGTTYAPEEKLLDTNTTKVEPPEVLNLTQDYQNNHKKESLNRKKNMTDSQVNDSEETLSNNSLRKRKLPRDTVITRARTLYNQALVQKYLKKPTTDEGPFRKKLKTRVNDRGKVSDSKNIACSRDKNTKELQSKLVNDKAKANNRNKVEKETEIKIRMTSGEKSRPRSSDSKNTESLSRLSKDLEERREKLPSDNLHEVFLNDKENESKKNVESCTNYLEKKDTKKTKKEQINTVEIMNVSITDINKRDRDIETNETGDEEWSTKRLQQRLLEIERQFRDKKKLEKEVTKDRKIEITSNFVKLNKELAGQYRKISEKVSNPKPVWNSSSRITENTKPWKKLENVKKYEYNKSSEEEVVKLQARKSKSSSCIHKEKTDQKIRSKSFNIPFQSYENVDDKGKEKDDKYSKLAGATVTSYLNKREMKPTVPQAVVRDSKKANANDKSRLLKRPVPTYTLTSNVTTPRDIIENQQRELDRYLVHTDVQGYFFSADQADDVNIQECVRQGEQLQKENEDLILSGDRLTQELEYLIKLEMSINEEITLNLENSMNYVKNILSQDFNGTAIIENPSNASQEDANIVFIEVNDDYTPTDGDHGGNAIQRDDIKEIDAKDDVFWFGKADKRFQSTANDSEYDCEVSITLNNNYHKELLQDKPGFPINKGLKQFRCDYCIEKDSRRNSFPLNQNHTSCISQRDQDITGNLTGNNSQNFEKTSQIPEIRCDYNPWLYSRNRESTQSLVSETETLIHKKEWFPFQTSAINKEVLDTEPRLSTWPLIEEHLPSKAVVERLTPGSVHTTEKAITKADVSAWFKERNNAPFPSPPTHDQPQQSCSHQNAPEVLKKYIYHLGRGEESNYELLKQPNKIEPEDLKQEGTTEKRVKKRRDTIVELPVDLKGKLLSMFEPEAEIDKVVSQESCATKETVSETSRSSVSLQCNLDEEDSQMETITINSKLMRKITQLLKIFLEDPNLELIESHAINKQKNKSEDVKEDSEKNDDIKELKVLLKKVLSSSETETISENLSQDDI